MAKRKRGGRPVNRAQVVRKDAMQRAPQTPALIQTALNAEGMDNSSNMGPGRPLNPYLGYSQDARRMDYPVGVNISTRSRESWTRISFETIKALIDAYDVSRMCINHKCDELRSMELLLLPADGVSVDVEGAIDAARAALAFPDRELPYEEWLAKLMENALRYDALPLYRRRNLGGDVMALEVLDGTTIAPYVDEHGRRPKPPAPAYYQLIKGSVWNWYTSDDIAYRRFRPQVDSPYGLAPIETILLTANTDLRFQWHFMQMFTEGSVPAGFVELPPDISSPDQVAEWQDYWDSVVLGDQAKLHQLIAVPQGTKVNQFRPEKFDPTFPEYLMSRTCAAFGVTPQDLGLTHEVNLANGETQVDIQFRVNTLPWVMWVQGILTRYLQMDLGLPVQAKLDTGRDKEDRLADAQAWQIYIESGMASVDEGRQELLGLPVDNERPMPRFFNSKSGPIPLGNIYAISGQIDPETAGPRDDVPLDLTPYDGANGVVPEKSPGATQFRRALINPDEPEFPALEHPVPGSDVVGTKPGAPVLGEPGVKVEKEATAGVTSATGITGSPLADADMIEPADEDDDGDDGDDEAVVKAELGAFRTFVKARKRRGTWRDFQFDAVDPITGHRLNDTGRAEVRKAAGSCVAAGLAVQAVDTGRVLMLQRALTDGDPAGGAWEFPGGHVEDGELPLDAAKREWCEETGCGLPEGEVTGGWTSGIYEGFVYTIPSENQIDIGGRDEFTNPDDPDGDVIEAIAWWAPGQLGGELSGGMYWRNPALRAELQAALPEVINSVAAALDSAIATGAAAVASGSSGLVCPCGVPVEFDASDGWQHADGSISHDDGESVSDKMAVAKAASGARPKA